MEKKLKIKYLDRNVPKISLPRAGDVGIDLYSTETCYIEVGSAALIDTGIAFGTPKGYAILLKDRSSVSKYGHVLAGVIDGSYVGPVKVRMYAHTSNYVDQEDGTQYFKIERGNKIAQAIIVQDLNSQFTLEESEELAKTERGDKGFGSTGK